MANEASSVAVEAAEKASNGISAERGVASGRSNVEFTAFVSNLPFTVTVDELREKFKHVSCSMSLLRLLYVTITPSLYRCHPLFVIVTLSLCYCQGYREGVSQRYSETP